MRMIVDEFLADAAAIASPGAEEICWLRRVRPGDKLFVTAEIVETRLSRSKPELGLVKARYTVRNQSEQIVMTMLGLGFFKCRPKSA